MYLECNGVLFNPEKQTDNDVFTILQNAEEAMNTATANYADWLGYAATRGLIPEDLDVQEQMLPKGIYVV